MSVACDGCQHHTLDPLPASPPGELLTIPLSPSRVPGPSSKALILLLKLARAAVVLSLNHFCLCLLNWLITSGVTRARSAPPCSQKPAPKKDMGRRNPGPWSRAGGEGPGLAGRRGGGPRGVGGRERGLEIALATLLQRILGAVQPASAPRGSVYQAWIFLPV